MRALLKIPAFLSSLLLAAHFLHAGQSLLTGICLLLPIALFFRTYWIIRLLQMVLLNGALVWLWTMVQLSGSFHEAGRSPRRMVIILTSVAAFTVLSAGLLQFSLDQGRKRSYSALPVDSVR
jgi:hypothetical protein